MKIITAPRFKKAYKKLHLKQQIEVEEAIFTISKSPLLGDLKKGDLAGLRVYKFRMNNQLALLAYHVNEEEDTIYVIDVGSHENFYRDLK